MGDGDLSESAGALLDSWVQGQSDISLAIFLILNFVSRDFHAVSFGDSLVCCLLCEATDILHSILSSSFLSSLLPVSIDAFSPRNVCR